MNSPIYHKIQTVYKRDPDNNYKTLLEGEFSKPEFEYLKDNIWLFSEKIDGMCVRCLWGGANVEFRGKTDRAQMPPILLAHLMQTLTKEKMLGVLGYEGGICLYGEGVGSRIQKGGGNYYKDQRFVLFDVRVGEWWLRRSDIEGIAKVLDIPVVPIIGAGTLAEAVEMARAGFKSQWGDFIAEGIVARPKVELGARDGSRIITKIKHKDFKE